MQNKFRIRFSSNLDYEEMVADICYEGNTVATISQENGIDKMEMEIFSSTKDEIEWKFFLDDFLKMVLEAKKTLICKQKLPENV